MNTAVLFATGKDDWATPPEVFDPLMDEFRFCLDAAATHENKKCALWRGPDHPMQEFRDGLACSWLGCGPVWVNPPYSRGLQKEFIEKAWESAIEGVTVVMLLPARTDTVAFHKYIWNRVDHKPGPVVREVRFLKGRIKFVGAPASAPFPSMIVVFGK